MKLIVEGRERPDRADGRADPLDKGIDILPDILANSGGVTVSYYEWVQNKRSERGTWKRSTSASPSG